METQKCEKSRTGVFKSYMTETKKFKLRIYLSAQFLTYVFHHENRIV
jgi:hypothetical protein